MQVPLPKQWLPHLYSLLLQTYDVNEKILKDVNAAYILTEDGSPLSASNYNPTVTPKELKPGGLSAQQSQYQWAHVCMSTLNPMLSHPKPSQLPSPTPPHPALDSLHLGTLQLTSPHPAPPHPTRSHPPYSTSALPSLPYLTHLTLLTLPYPTLAHTSPRLTSPHLPNPYLTPPHLVVPYITLPYLAGKEGIMAICSKLGLSCIAPRRKINVMIVGNHSAGKS